jgi:putative ABC transport system permease protein
MSVNNQVSGNSKATGLASWATMARIGWRMMFYDKAKLVGTLFGVMFAVLLANQQLGISLGLINKNTMFADHSRADIWITAPSATNLDANSLLSNAELMAARSVDGVMVAEPLIYSNAGVLVPGGGTEPVTLIGTKAPFFLGGPWNYVAGDDQALLQPGAMAFDTLVRDDLGGLKVGDIREVNGTKVVVGALTWGLQGFAPPFAFAEYNLALRLTKRERAQDRFEFVLVKVAEGRDVEEVRAAIASRVPTARVYTRAGFVGSIVKVLVTESQIGVSFGTSTFFGLLIGFVIVALSMFSAVLDNIREFGTLKAIGATTWDLTKLLAVQSVTYALVGWFIGTFVVTRVARGIRSPELSMIVPPWLMAGSLVVMLGICLAASCLALMRIRKVEPGMVFR